MSMTYEESLADTRASAAVPVVPNNVLKQFDLTGKVCVVTGASRGIGYAVAEGFAEAGASVVLGYTSDRPMDQMALEWSKRFDVPVKPWKCNVSDAEQVENMISGIVQELGRIDVFVANAGICIPNSILDETPEQYHTQMGINVNGVYYCAKYAGQVFKQQGFGNFIVTSSISGQVATVPESSPTYDMTKAAVAQLGRSLAREWRSFARVNIVSPGWIDTSMSTDVASTNEAKRMAVMGRLGDAKELKAMYLYLASAASSFVTGQNFTIDGGYTAV